MAHLRGRKLRIIHLLVSLVIVQTGFFLWWYCIVRSVFCGFVLLWRGLFLGIEIMAAAALSRLFGVAGKIAVVTGGGRGIGEMIAKTYVQLGAKASATFEWAFQLG
jgi:hypothetical protein